LPKRGGGRSPQIFDSCLLWPNGWKDQDGTWTEVGFSPGDLAVLDGDPAPSQKRGCIQPFGHNRSGPKIGEGGSAPFLERGAGFQSNTKSPGLRYTSGPSGILIHAAIWPQQIWTENWGLCPFRGGGAGFPSNTMWPGPRPTCLRSFILIRPTVWPQCTNVADRTDRQDRQRSDSITRTFYKRSSKSGSCSSCSLE